MNKEGIRNITEKIAKSPVGRRVVPAVISLTALTGLTVGMTGCSEGQEIPLITPTTAAARPTPIVNNYNYYTTINQPEKTMEPIKPIKTETPENKPECSTNTKPESRANWINNPIISEINQPNYGTTIEKYIAPNHIGAVSGGSGTIHYVDNYGNEREKSLTWKKGRVYLILQEAGSHREKMSITNVVNKENWFGEFQPSDLQNSKELVDAKVKETMKSSTSIRGGADEVYVVVMGTNHKIIFEKNFSDSCK